MDGSDDDWASGDEEGFGDISELPEVEVAAPPPRPEPPRPAPVPNAWTSAPSNDVRGAARAPPQARLHLAAQRPAPGAPRTGPVPGTARPGPAPGFARTAPTTDLYVSNLPFEANEGSIAGFFSTVGVTPRDVRIQRHSDSGNIKGAIVTVRDSHLDEALKLKGRFLSSRAIHVKVDGEGRRRDRPGYGFGNPERQQHSHRETGWGTGQWTEANSNHHGRRPGSSDVRNVHPSPPVAAPEARSEQPSAPAPAASGRKKLVLKPRTKPPPKLEVDQRAIDVPRQSSSNASNDSRLGTSGRGGAAARRGRGGAWSTQRESSAPREKPAQAPTSQSQKASQQQQQQQQRTEEDTNGLVVGNAFSALQVNDTDV